MTILAVGFALSLKPLKPEAAWPRVSATSIISEQEDECAMCGVAGWLTLLTLAAVLLLTGRLRRRDNS